MTIRTKPVNICLVDAMLLFHTLDRGAETLSIGTEIKFSSKSCGPHFNFELIMYVILIYLLFSTNSFYYCHENLANQVHTENFSLRGGGLTLRLNIIYV
jgi:hypothetical protein